MVKLRFRRMGRKKLPVFSLVATDSRSPRDGRYIEDLGRFYPLTSPVEHSLNRERILYWLQQGAQPSDTVRNILRREGMMLELHLRRKDASEEEIAGQVEAHRARWAERAETAKERSPEDRRKEALAAERKAATEERKRIEAERKEREAELERRRKEAEEAERAAAAEEMKGEKEDTAEEEPAEAAEAKPSDASVVEEESVGTRRAVSASEDETDSKSETVATQSAESPEEEAPDEAEDEAAEEAKPVADAAEETDATEAETEEDTEAAEATAAKAEKKEEEAKAEKDDLEAEEAEPEPAAEVEPEDATPDTLTDVWGIGPKYASILNDAGVQTFAVLAEKSVEDLQTIITDAGSTTAGNEETWAEQAALLAKGDNEGHDTLVEKLKAD